MRKVAYRRGIVVLRGHFYGSLQLGEPAMSPADKTGRRAAQETMHREANGLTERGAIEIIPVGALKGQVDMLADERGAACLTVSANRTAPFMKQNQRALR